MSKRENEILKAAAQSYAEEKVMGTLTAEVVNTEVLSAEVLAADALASTVTHGPPPVSDYQQLLSLLRSLDGPQSSLRSSGYSRPVYPQTSNLGTTS